MSLTSVRLPRWVRRLMLRHRAAMLDAEIRTADDLILDHQARLRLLSEQLRAVRAELALVTPADAMMRELLARKAGP